MQNEEILNLQENELFGLISRFNLQPLGNKVIITLNNHVTAEDSLDMDIMLNEEQYVIAIGEYVRTIIVGDKVAIDLEKLLVSVHDPNDSYSKITKIKVNPVRYENYTFGIIDANDIKYIIK